MKRRTVLGGIVGSPALLLPSFADASTVTAQGVTPRILVMGLGGAGHTLVRSWQAKLGDEQRSRFLVFTEPFDEGIKNLNTVAWAADTLSRYAPAELKDVAIVFGMGGKSGGSMIETLGWALHAQGIPAGIIPVTYLPDQQPDWSSDEEIELGRGSWQMQVWRGIGRGRRRPIIVAPNGGGVPREAFYRILERKVGEFLAVEPLNFAEGFSPRAG